MILGLVGAFAVLLTAFVWWERRAVNPLLPPRLFADPALRVALPATMLLGALLGGSVVYLPTYLQGAYGMGATQAGLALNPYVVTFMAVSFLAGARVGRSGRYKSSLVAGSLVVVLGFALVSQIGPGTAYAVLALELGVLGVGFGLLMQNLVVVAQNAASPADLAAVTSATLSVRGLGMSLGVASFGSLLTRQLQGGGAQTAEATAAAVPEVLLWGVPTAAALVVLLALLPHSVNRSSI
ncbi:MFS transporter [Nonomuraea dietziae]|uniref:MFS transporter n=1 Tax=Nonomuraea dietziae TaxID=65515 RepID=UPI003434EF76